MREHPGRLVGGGRGHSMTTLHKILNLGPSPNAAPIKVNGSPTTPLERSYTQLVVFYCDHPIHPADILVVVMEQLPNDRQRTRTVGSRRPGRFSTGWTPPPRIDC